MSDTVERAKCRWRSLLCGCGIPAEHLTGKRGPCPLCGGKDRFRFDDKNGSGSWICNQCGSGFGIHLVMKFHDIEFSKAARMVDDLLPNSKIEFSRPVEKKQRDYSGLWQSAGLLDGLDPASVYLKSRGIDLRKWPGELRYLPSLAYKDKDRPITTHPAMIARFVGDGAASYHVTYLTEDGAKADVPTARKILPGTMPIGGAVQLYGARPTLGIAEGIETALAAMTIFKLPVWSALTARMMMKFRPPLHVERVIVFGDNDRNWQGQLAAMSLASQLADSFEVDVRFPEIRGEDWLDVLNKEQTR